ncbi:MAG: hypothetical protein HOU01_17975 [Streptomycetaceae bacterium]|nr:hypothetical protein [Streptomycetaceae bacterium]
MKVAIVVTLAIVTFFACLLAVMWIGLSWPASPPREDPRPLAFALLPVLEEGTQPCAGGMRPRREGAGCYRLGSGMNPVTAEKAERALVSGWVARVTLRPADAAALAALADGVRHNRPPANQVAVVIGGEVYATIELKAPFTGRTLDIPADLDRDMTDELVRRLNVRDTTATALRVTPGRGTACRSPSPS